MIVVRVSTTVAACDDEGDDDDDDDDDEDDGGGGGDVEKKAFWCESVVACEGRERFAPTPKKNRGAPLQPMPIGRPKVIIICPRPAAS